MTTEMDALPESVAPQRWHATGDYAYPAEERDDGEFVDYDDYARLSARVQELERENAGLRAMLDGWRTVTYQGKDYVAAARVEIDALRERADRAESELAAIEKRIADAVHVVVREDTSPWSMADRCAMIAISLPTEMIGKRVALLPLDDEESKR